MMRTLHLRLALGLATLLMGCHVALGAELLAGFAAVNITPPLGLEMEGFPLSGQRRGNAIHDPLMAHAMVLDLDGKRIAIVGCDLVGLPLEFTRKVRTIAEAGTGIPGERIMVSATHSHSGPVMYKLIGGGEGDGNYLRSLPQKVAEAVIEASQKLQPAQAFYGEAPVEAIGSNREYPEGPVDRKLRVLSFMHAGQMLGFIVHYSVHNVTLSEQMRQYSADLTGVGIAKVLKEYPGSVGIYLQGSCGDINPAGFVNNRPPDQCLRLLEELSDRFAGYVRLALKSASPLKVDRIDMATKSFELPLVPTDRALVLRDMQLAGELLNEPNLSPGARRDLEFLRDSSRAILDRYKRYPLTERETEIQALRIQDLLILANPGEVFITLAGQICRMLPQWKVWVTGYANDIVGYIPTPDRYDSSAEQFSYSAYLVPLAVGDFRFREDVGDVLVQALVSFAQEITAP